MAHQNYTTLSGRRVYYEVLHHLRVNDGRGMMNALADLGKLPFPGDTPEQLTKWAHNVASLARRAEAEGSPHSNIYYAIRECLRHSKSLDYKREVYEQMNLRDHWRWPQLLDLVFRYLDDEHEASQKHQYQQDLAQQFAGTGAGSRAARKAAAAAAGMQANPGQDNAAAMKRMAE